MSRKAFIPEEERREWSCVRAWAATKGYNAYKPADGYLHNALIVLEHEFPSTPDAPRNPIRSLAGVAQELLFADSGDGDAGAHAAPDAQQPGHDAEAGGAFSAVFVVDFARLLVLRESDEPDLDIVGDEALLPQFGKRMEKPLVRFLERLHLRGATIVARGACCQFVFKLLSPVASRALTSENVRRVVMLHPALSPAFINEQLGVAAADKLKGVELHVVYPNSKEQRRRDPVLRHYCPAGTSDVCGAVTRENLAVLLPLLARPHSAAEGGPLDAALPPAYDAERRDAVGRSLFFAEVRIMMDPNTKMDVQVSIDATAELQAPEVAAEDEANAGAPVDAADCTREVGALVLRGNRCVLCRSLDGEWEGMRVPSLERRRNAGDDADGDEAPLACATRSISELCEIDGATRVVPLPDIAPFNIYMPGGRPVIVSVHVFYTVNPPPDGPLEDADAEDEDDACDWYTFARAVAALQRHGDDATTAALQSLAFALRAAASARVLPDKWGGVFGQEFAARALGLGVGHQPEQQAAGGGAQGA